MVTIAPAQLDDVDAIRRLLSATWRATYSRTYPADAIEGITETWHDAAGLRRQIADPKVCFAVARSEDAEVIGIITLVRREDGRTVDLSRLYVLPSHQRQGIGNELLQYGLRAVSGSRRIVLAVESSNHIGHAFWLKHGFRETGTTTEHVADVTLELTQMEKVLE